jgi:hypothetical protein
MHRGEKKWKCVSVGKHGGNRRLGRTPHRWTNNVKLGLNETEWENVGGSSGLDWWLLRSSGISCDYSDESLGSVIFEELD